jgi:putative ABC transport system permease protein
MRHAIRSLVRSPGFAAAAIAPLAIALAFNTASLGLLNGLLRHPYPYPAIDRLVLVRDARPAAGAHQGHALTPADFLDIRDGVHALTAVAAWRAQPLVVTGAGDPERIEAAAVTAGFFDTLGVVSMLGRTFERDADTPGHDGVVVFSRRLWISRFGGDPGVVGREVRLNGRPATVVGILRDEDCYQPGIDAWVPLVLSPADRAERATPQVAVVARLAAGITQARAERELTALAGTLAVRYPSTNRGRGFELLPLVREQYEFTAPLFLFVQAAALLVLALAAIDVGSLLVGRALDRRRDLAVRAMLGAGGWRVASVGVLETVALSAVAIAIGTAAARGALAAMRASLPEGIARWIAGWQSLRLDAGSLLSGAGLGVLVMAALSLVVAATSARVSASMETAGRVTRRGTAGRRLVIAGQVGLTAALLLAASATVAGFHRMAAAFDALSPQRVLRFTLTLPEARYPDTVHLASFHAALIARLDAIPQVERAAVIRNEPASNVPNALVPFLRVDAAPLPPGERPRIDVDVASPSAFDLLHLDVIAGRALADRDAAGSAPTAVITRTAARRFWPDRDPVGTTVHLGAAAQVVTIVGVVSDFVLNWYDPDLRPVLFLPAAQAPPRTVAVLVRTRTDPLAIAREVRAAVAGLDERQPIAGVEPLAATVADSLSPVRVIGRLLITGAATSAILAAVGIFAVLAHWVAARRRELGVRMAFGATHASIARLVLREALLTAAAGMAAGIGSAIAGIRLAGPALLGVPALDPGTTAAVAGGAVLLALAASLVPVRRAVRADVAELLRCG